MVDWHANIKDGADLKQDPNDVETLYHMKIDQHSSEMVIEAGAVALPKHHMSGESATYQGSEHDEFDHDTTDDLKPSKVFAIAISLSKMPMLVV